MLAHRCDWEGSTIVAAHELAGEAVQVALAVDDREALGDLFSADEHRLPATLALERYGARWFASGARGSAGRRSGFRRGD